MARRGLIATARDVLLKGRRVWNRTSWGEENYWGVPKRCGKGAPADVRPKKKGKEG